MGCKVTKHIYGNLKLDFLHISTEYRLINNKSRKHLQISILCIITRNEIMWARDCGQVPIDTNILHGEEMLP
jgi:hypothetical protein